MDDLIIIILTLIIAGVGALGQLKKKKQASGTEQQTKKPETFWDLIQGGTNDRQPGSEVDYEDPEFEGKGIEPIEEPKVMLKKPVTPFKTRAMEGADAGKGAVKTKKKKLKSILNEDFSLRKAVIYSEILNRKYN